MAQPDLLATTRYRHQSGEHGERIEDAIVSPLMRRKHKERNEAGEPSMRLHRSGTVVKRRKPSRRKPAKASPSSQGQRATLGRSNSLPNLAELEDLEEGGGEVIGRTAASKRHTFFPMHE